MHNLVYKIQCIRGIKVCFLKFPLATLFKAKILHLYNKPWTCTTKLELAKVNQSRICLEWFRSKKQTHTQSQKHSLYNYNSEWHGINLLLLAACSSQEIDRKMSFLCNHRCFDRHKEVLAHRMRTMVEIIRAVDDDVEELHLCRNLFLGALALVCSTRKWLPAQPRHNPPRSIPVSCVRLCFNKRRAGNSSISCNTEQHLNLISWTFFSCSCVWSKY